MVNDVGQHGLATRECETMRQVEVTYYYRVMQQYCCSTARGELPPFSFYFCLAAGFACFIILQFLYIYSILNCQLVGRPIQAPRRWTAVIFILFGGFCLFFIVIQFLLYFSIPVLNRQDVFLKALLEFYKNFILLYAIYTLLYFLLYN